MKKSIGHIGMGPGRHPDSGKGETVELLGIRYSKDKRPRFDVVRTLFGGRKVILSRKKTTLKNCYLGRMLHAAHEAGEKLERERHMAKIAK